jgi:hypothetical protein
VYDLPKARQCCIMTGKQGFMLRKLQPILGFRAKIPGLHSLRQAVNSSYYRQAIRFLQPAFLYPTKPYANRKDIHF